MSSPSSPFLEKGGTARLFEALRFAADRHRDGRRKGQTAAPYINHPIAVAEQLAAAGFGEDIDLLIAALLHDVVEDTPTSADELRRRFGDRVADIVIEVTDDKSLDWRERKRRVVQHVGRLSRQAQLIKLSDLSANITDLIHHPPNWATDRKRGYLMWAEAVVDAMSAPEPSLERRFRDLLREARGVVGVG
jgi:guanosine-3',5'-bis(diphosphate) 3'-pyrophosphohydrolase